MPEDVLPHLKCVLLSVGRDCTYYKAIKGDLQGFVHLMESKPSPPINMQNKSYTGVKIKAARV